MLVLWLFSLAFRAFLSGLHPALEALEAARLGPQGEPGDDQFCVMPERFLWH